MNINTKSRKIISGSHVINVIPAQLTHSTQGIRVNCHEGTRLYHVKSGSKLNGYKKVNVYENKKEQAFRKINKILGGY